MKEVNVFDLLDITSRFNDSGMHVVKEDCTDKDFGLTLESFAGVVGKHRNELVKKGIYLYADSFCNDESLINMATQIYPLESSYLLYFKIKEDETK